MITQVRVRLLTAVEDSRRHPVLDVNGNVQIDPATGDMIAIERVDRFAEGWEGELPSHQAQHLISLGFAEAAAAP